jgi:UDP-GlcNAc:undecaprenyl-phosphate GlcNAc-1-phosphate transferase
MTALPVIVAVVAFGLSLGLTFAARSVARRFNFIAEPRADRWHRHPTALLGGAAMAVAFAVPVLCMGFDREVWQIVVLVLAVSGIGLADDLHRLNPGTKLTFLAVTAATALFLGYRLGWTGSLTADSLLTLLWLVGLANAFNLLDNMDGLAAGVAGIASLAYLVLASTSGAASDVLLFAALTGSVLGFLVFNFQPASIFMGDAGSLFLGFTLALLSTKLGPGLGAAGTSPVLIPVAILSVPIFDTTLVTFLRGLAGRRIAVGGRDHSSHRLVAFGLPERRAVLVLYGCAAVAAAAGLSVYYLDLSHANILVGLFLVALTFFGVHLAHVHVSEAVDVTRTSVHGTIAVVLRTVNSRTRVLDVLLDVCVVTLAYYTAYRIRFDDAAFVNFFPVFLRSLPIVVAVSIASLWWTGAYRGLWSYFAVADGVVLARATALATICSVAAVSYVFRFEHHSRAVFVISGALTFALLAAGRASFRMAHDLAGRAREDWAADRRVVIYGVGDVGFNVLQMARSSRLAVRVVGLVDDDPGKHGRSVLGVDVLGGFETLLSMVEGNAVEGVLVSTLAIEAARLDRLRTVCRDHDVFLLRFRAGFEDLLEPARQAAPSIIRAANDDAELVHFAEEWWPGAIAPPPATSRLINR